MNIFARLIVIGLCLIAIVKSFNLEIDNTVKDNVTYEIRSGL